MTDKPILAPDALGPTVTVGEILAKIMAELWAKASPSPWRISRSIPLRR